MAEGVAYIPIEEWSEFVAQYMPKTAGEVALGEPTIVDDEVEVPFAINTECHPQQQSVKPRFMRDDTEC